MIPKLHYISQGNSPKAHLDHIQNACAAGAELVVLNLQNSSEKKYLKIVKQAREITSHFQTRLIISAHYKIAKELKVDGIHLDFTSPCPTIIRKELLPWQLIGATANNLQDCETLHRKGSRLYILSSFQSN